MIASSPEDGCTELQDIAVLCAERVAQMTTTYNDIGTIRELLEEKERDLELAARIGQSLLANNEELKQHIEDLKDQVSHNNEKINQLKHELSQKDQLIQVYNQDLQDHAGGYAASDGAPGLSQASVETLQKKVLSLEEENHSLRLENDQLRKDTEDLEEKDRKNEESFQSQLVERGQQLKMCEDDLRLRNQENQQHKEDMGKLRTEQITLKKQIQQLKDENKDIMEKLQASEELQNQMAVELRQKKDRLDELFELRERLQEELLHHHRSITGQQEHAGSISPLSSVGMDSLAAELVQTEDHKRHRSGKWRVFQTAKAVRRATSRSRASSFVESSWTDTDSQAASVISSDAESVYSDGYSGDMDSTYGSAKELGRPGIPGSNDLESALRRLAVTQPGDTKEQGFSDLLRETRSEGMSPFIPAGTPDSMSSTPSGYSYLGSSNHHTSSGSSRFKIPDKLQIVKPLEGSVTLRHWQRLAQPHLGGLFERRDGVKVKGERRLDLNGEAYTLSDFEEDDLEDSGDNSSDQFRVRPVFGFGDSPASTPGRRLSTSSASPHQPVAITPPQSSSTPVSKSNNSSSTATMGRSFTMSLGLAAILQDRDASSASSPSSATRSLLPSSPSCPVIPADTVATSGPAPLLSPLEEEGTSIHSPGLFGKLVNTGYNLLWNKPAPPVSSASSPSFPQDVAQAEGAKSAKKPTASQILPGRGSGVLGAITTLRKSGVL